MNLMLLAFGPNLRNHHQACFAILTLLKESPPPRITVYTDMPELYRAFLGRRVVLETTPYEKLQRWQGRHQFFWRIECMAVQEMARRHPGEHLIYVDSDTFLADGLHSGVVRKLEAGTALMHEDEGLLRSLRTRTERGTWEALRGRRFCGVPVDRSTRMWNAGVIAIPGAHAEAVADRVVEVCDALCETPAPRRLLEQLAFSVTLEHLVGIEPASPWVGHYWGNKDEWNAAIGQFLIASRLGKRTLDDDIALLRDFDFSRIPVRKKQKNTKLRLQRLLDQHFPLRETIYFANARDSET